MTTNNDAISLEDKILSTIYSFEKKRVSITILKYLGAIAFITISSVLLITTIIAIFMQEQTFSILELFSEDWFIIKEYYTDILYILYYESPKTYIALFLGSLVVLTIITVLFLKKYPVIKNKIQSITSFNK